MQNSEWDLQYTHHMHTLPVLNLVDVISKSANYAIVQIFIEITENSTKKTAFLLTRQLRQTLHC